jgi:SAM-dependent methyltransferase
MKIDHKESFGDFGEQFTNDKKIDGYFGSLGLIEDIVYPFDLKEINDKIVAEIGIGSGRIIKNLIKFNPKKIYGIEPSKAIDIAKSNLGTENINFLNIKAEDLDFYNEIDYIFSIGVIHHIPNYRVAIQKINKSLKPGGKFIMWVYGKEGNELYLLLFNNLRRITIYLPDFILRIISKSLALTTYVYGFLCKFLKLPLNKYFNNIFNNFSFQKRSYVIFDQLNPSFAKYFTKEELEELLQKENFKIIELQHRHGYSHTVICEKK